MKRQRGTQMLIVLGAAIVASASVYAVRLSHSIPVPGRSVQVVERAHTPPGMVYVPGGPCLLGSDDADADDDVKPMRRESVASFYIDKTEVTNAEYKRFKPDHEYPPNEDSLPATNVTFDEAAAYARWAGKRLPTEAEWEKAARGTGGRRYPWGNTWNPDFVAKRAQHAGSGMQLVSVKKPGRCVIGASRVQPVGTVVSGASPYGCVDMAGNAWEWVAGYYNGDPTKRILRGGAVGYGERSTRTYNRAIEGAGDT